MHNFSDVSRLTSDSYHSKRSITLMCLLQCVCFNAYGVWVQFDPRALPTF